MSDFSKAVDYARLNYEASCHAARYRRRVESQVTKLVCQECRGMGSYVEPVLDFGEGPSYQCGWCCGTGYLTPYLRGLWLREKAKEKGLA